MKKVEMKVWAMIHNPQDGTPIQLIGTGESEDGLWLDLLRDNASPVHELLKLRRQGYESYLGHVVVEVPDE